MASLDPLSSLPPGFELDSDPTTSADPAATLPQGFELDEVGDAPKPNSKPDLSSPSWKHDRTEPKMVDGKWYMRVKRSGAIVNMDEGSPDFGMPTDDPKILQAFGKTAPTKEATKQIAASRMQPDDSTWRSDLETGWYNLRQGVETAAFVGATEALKQDGDEITGGLAGFKIPRAMVEKAQGKALTGIAEFKGKSDAMPKAPAMERFNNSKTWGEAWSNFAADPYTVARSTVLQSAPSSMPSVVGGIIGSVAGPLGAAGGAGAGSYITELGDSIGQGLEEHGADLSSPESVKKVWAEHGPAIMQKANVRAAVIGAVDAATGGVTSKIVEQPAKGLLGEIGRDLVGTGVQMAGGAGGEAAAEVATGDPLNPAAILGEAIGEAGSGAAEVAGQSMVGAVKAARGAKGDRLDVSPDPQPPEGFDVDEVPARPAAAAGGERPAPGSAPWAPGSRALETLPEGYVVDEERPASKADERNTHSSPAVKEPESEIASGPKGLPKKGETTDYSEKGFKPESDLPAVGDLINIPTFGGKAARVEIYRYKQNSKGIWTYEAGQNGHAISSGVAGMLRDHMDSVDQSTSEIDGTDAIPRRAEDGDIETARAEVEPAASEPQKLAGNYRKGHIKVHGLDITIETARGQKRTGKDASGKEWSVKMADDYGYVKRTTGADGEQVDVFLGPDLNSEQVFVIDQVDPDTKAFDEHKVVMGADNETEARAIYERAYSDGKAPARVGGIKAMSVPEFKTWLEKPQTRPASGAAAAPGQTQTPEHQPPSPTSPTPTKVAVAPSSPSRPAETGPPADAETARADAAVLPAGSKKPKPSSKSARARASTASAAAAPAPQSASAPATPQPLKTAALGIEGGRAVIDAWSPTQNYRAIGKFKPTDKMNLAKDAGRYVVEQGKAIGGEAILILTGDGTVVADGSGASRTVGWPPAAAELFLDPKADLVVHHNHPSSTSLSIADVAYLAFPGLKVVWAHGNAANVFRASLPPAIRRLDPDALARTIWRARRAAELPIYDELQKRILENKLSPPDASALHAHIANLALHNSGLIDYYTDYSPDLTTLGDALQQATAAARTTAESIIDANALAEARGSDRSAVAFRHVGDMGISSPHSGGPAPGRVSPRRAGRRGKGNDRQETDELKSTSSSEGGFKEDTSPVAAIDGKELGVDFKGPEDMPALRRAAQKWYDTNLRGTTVRRPDGIEVAFSRRGRNESTGPRKTDTILRAVPAIRAIIEQGQEVSRVPGDRQGVKEAVYIAAPVDVAGKIINLGVILQVREDGTWHYDFGYAEDTGSPGVGGPGGPASRGSSRHPAKQSAPDVAINLFEMPLDFKVGHLPAPYRIPLLNLALTDKQRDKLRASLKDLGRRILGHDTKVWLFDRISDDKDQGVFDHEQGAVIISALDAADHVETLGHEAIHALRHLGVFTEQEWATLSKWAKEKFIPLTNIRELYSKRYGEGLDLTPDQLEEMIIEEGIADGYGRHLANRLTEDTPSTVRSIFAKLRRFLEALGNMLRGKGFKAADEVLSDEVRDIFGRINSGEFATRPRGIATRGFEIRARVQGDDAGLANVQRPEALIGDPYDVAKSSAAREELSDIASNINLDYLAAPDDIKKVISDVSDKSRHFIGARRGVITNDQTRELAADLGMTVADLKKRRHGQAFNAENIFAARVLLVKSAIRLRELAAKARKTEKLADLAEFQKAFTRHVAIQEQVAGLAAEAGRALQQFKMMAGDNFYKGAKDLVEIARAKNPDDPFGKKNKFGKDAVLDLAEMVDALDDPAAINRFSRDTYRVTIGNMIREAWINALLSGFRTHATNILSNTLTALWQVPETAVSAAIGAMHGGEKVQFREASARLVGLVEGAKEGLRSGATAFKTGEPSDLGSKIESHRTHAIPGTAGEIIRIPSRALLAEDEVFKAVNYRAEINAQAVRIAMAEGRRGQSLARRIAQLRADPTQAMKTEAHKAALYNTFQNDLGVIGKTVTRMRESIPGAWIILPFIKTPANIIKYAAERSPFGLLMQNVRDNLNGKNGNVARDTQAARMFLGTSLGISVAMMVGAGIISGGGPDDPDERKLLLAKGWQPYSVKIGETWYSYQRLDPLGFMMGVSADLVELGEAVSSAEADKVGAMIVSSISGNLLEKTWLRGIGDLIQAVQNPKQHGDYYIRGLAGTLIPTGVAQVAQTTDPVLRDARTIVDVLKSRIPGMTQDLKPRRDFFGEEIRRQGALGPDLISPIFTSTERSDPVIDAMIGLHYTPSMPRREINGHHLTDAQYDEYLEMSGKAAKKVLDRKVGLKSWQSKDPDEKTKLIRDVFNDARDDARKKMKRKYRELRKKP